MKQLIIFFLLNTQLIFAQVTIEAGDKRVSLINMFSKGINNVRYACTDNTPSKFYEGFTGEHGDGVFIVKTNCPELEFSLIGTNGSKIILNTISTSFFDSNNYKLFITNLAGAATTDTNNQRVKNIARLLLSLDNNQNEKDNIDINSSLLDNTLGLIGSTIDENTNINDLNAVVQKQFPERELISELCAIVHLERTLKKHNFNIDTVPPCKPKLVYEINSTSNNVTYVELEGEGNTNIHLNNVDTGLDLDENGNFLEFRLSTPIELNSFDEFNISLVDSKGQRSEIKTVKIFNDPDQPYFNSLPSTINSSSTNILDLNVSDTSKDHNLSNFSKLKLKYEILDNNISGHRNNFEIDENGTLKYKNNVSSGTYYVKIKVSDEVLHFVEANLTITKP